MGKKTNPRKIPRTQEDVDRAWKDGVRVGVHNASAMFMNVLVDKYDGMDKLANIWDDVTKLSEEVLEGRVNIPDIVTMLREEYNIII